MSGSSARVTSLDATGLPIFFANADRPISTIFALSMSLVGLIRSPR